MLNFDYNISTRIHFGKNAIDKLRNELIGVDKRILLIYGQGSIKKTNVYTKVTQILHERNLFIRELKDIPPNPRLSNVRTGIELCRDYDIQFILAVGGGSVIDCAKTIAAGYYYDGDVWDIFLGEEQGIKKALPIGTVLTLTATGSEMNGNAVITNEKTQEKLAFHTDLIRPRFSILDPTITFSVPKQQTAVGVVDIFSHILEQYFSHTSEAFVQNRIAEALLLSCIKYGAVALEHPDDYEARANLMWTSSLALNGLLTYGKQPDWATHSIEHAISAVFDITHAIGLAILTPVWMDYVFSDNTVKQMATYAKNVWHINNRNHDVAAKKGIEKTKEFFMSLGMPTKLSQVGVTYESLELIAKKATKFGSIGHYKKLTTTDVLRILERAF